MNIQSSFAGDFLEYVKKQYASPGDCVVQDPQKRFIVICPDEGLAKKLLEKELALYGRFHQTFKTLVLWEDPAIVKIFADRAAYVSTFNIPGSSAFMAKFTKDSRTHRLISSWMQEGLIENLIPHETAHIFVADLARVDEINSQKGERVLPRWIDEGLAQYFQQSDDLLLYKTYLMNMAFTEKGFIPFSEFFSLTDYPDNTYFFYIQSLITTQFLLSQHLGYQKIRNYVTLFRSKVKEGSRAFDLSFPEYVSRETLRSKIISWCRKKIASYKPDISALNGKLASESRFEKFNENLYKEIAFGIVSYQLFLNENYEGAFRLSGAGVKLGNSYFPGYNAQVRSLIKLGKRSEANALLEKYRKEDRKTSLQLLADISHDDGKYSEEIELLKQLFDVDETNRYYICMRIAMLYGNFLKDYGMANFYMQKARAYPVPE